MTTLEDIERRNPEWRPWLRTVGELIAQLDDPEWDCAVPPLKVLEGGIPLAVSVVYKVYAGSTG